MKKFSIITLILTIVLTSFMPFYKVEAATPYTVEMVSNNTNNAYVGSYSSYEDAVKAMNSQNSTSTSVATIYKDGVPIDSKYAIFKFKPTANNEYYNLYSSSTGPMYTGIHTNSGSDAALLGYSTNGRVKIMISGYVGWTEIENGVITPISLLAVNGNTLYVPGKSNKVRVSPSTTATVIATITSPHTFTYTEIKDDGDNIWYKISYDGRDAWIAKGDSMTIYNNGDSSLNTYYEKNKDSGNLIHHFTYYAGTGYGNSFTNLGKAPDYLTPGVKYYSFDGNYFYSTLTDMLDDYRNFSYNGNVTVGDYNRSINKDNPFYAYFLYLPSHSVTGYTAEDFDNIIASKGYTASTSKMYGTGKYFKEAEAKYGQNALTAFGTAINESAYGTSRIAMDKNNLFGYGAYDSCAYDCAKTYDSPRDSIIDYAKTSGSSYSLVTGNNYHGGHYGNKAGGRNVRWATDPYWGEKQAANSLSIDNSYGGKEYNSTTIGVAKKGHVWVQVFKSPNQSDYLYTMKNPNSNENIYDMSVSIVDKVQGVDQEYYKIYTDLPASDNNVFGYVKVSDFNVSNNQPVIIANDLTITEGSSFNPMDWVSASDVENGNLTDRVTYDSDVKPDVEGTYHVTYNVVDNSNFHASKTITVKVVSNEMPTIEASNREVKQFSEFKYMDGVKATAADGTDITDDVTYEETVNTDVVDTYEVTYKIKDSKGKEASKTITVTVIPNEKPVINVEDKEIYLNSDFDPLDGVTASDAEDGPITDIEYDSDVKPDVIGDYKVTYTVQDKNGQVTTKIITVKVIANQLPVINAYDKTIYLNSKFEPLEGVTASDAEDGPITDIKVDKNDVKTDSLGKYDVTYSVTDSYNQTVTKTITVTVVEKVLEKKDGRFDLEYFKYIDNQLYIKGFSTIDGINNDLNTNISYKLKFVNLDNNKVFEQDLNRVVNSDDIPYEVPSSDGKKYTYAWFEGNIDLSSIDAGNYNMYVVASSDDYYSENLVNNQIFSEQVASAYDDSGKYIITRNDYFAEGKPLQLLVRNEKLADKTADSTTNQYGQLDDMHFEKNGLLYLKGNSFSYGSDLSSTSNVKRTIIFENIDTLERYTFDLGSITDGTYEVKMPVSDGLSKDRAWFEKTIDLSNLPKGRYVIYINTISNISDISELNDQAFYGFDNVNGNFDSKTYSFLLNENQRYRLELKIS